MIAWVPVGAAAALMAWKPRLAWRWMTGLPMDGPPGRPRYRTDASWNLPATKRLHPVPVIRWHWWRRRRRAAIRGGGTLAVLTLAEGLLTVPGWTLAALAVAAIIAAWLIVPRATRKVTGWQHHRTYELPTAASYRDAVGALPVRLAIEPDRSAVTIDLHPEFSGSPADIGAKIAEVLK